MCDYSLEFYRSRPAQLGERYETAKSYTGYPKFAQLQGTASIPEWMVAVAIDRFGGPDVLNLHTLHVPRPSRDEVLIAVHTAGVGPWDAEIREGWIDGHARFPLVLGTDGSGTVVTVGSRVRRL